MRNAECGIGEAGMGRLKCAGWRPKVAGVGEGCICFGGVVLAGRLGLSGVAPVSNSRTFAVWI
jgi:hypothetical protein